MYDMHPCIHDLNIYTHAYVHMYVCLEMCICMHAWT